MKTIRNKKTGELKRLNDREAHKMIVTTYLGWEYVPKQVWKKETRTESVKQNNPKLKK